MKEKFSDIYSCKTKERIIACSKERNVKPVFRLIRHSSCKPIVKEDFYPTIMQYNNNVMPPYERQDAKTNICNFAVSLFVSEESLLNYITLVPSERNSDYFVARGSIETLFGLATDIDERNHIDFFSL